MCNVYHPTGQNDVFIAKILNPEINRKWDERDGPEAMSTSYPSQITATNLWVMVNDSWAALVVLSYAYMYIADNYIVLIAANSDLSI